MAKCGIQTIHGKYYLCTKPGCSEAANNGDSEITSVELYVSVSLHASYCYCSFSGSRQTQSGGATSSLCKSSTVSRHFGAETKICVLQICHMHAFQNITLRFQGIPAFIEI